MNTRYSVPLAMLAGIAIGAAAVQTLHAQGKPKAYLVTETEILDQAALAEYTPKAQANVKTAGGRGGVVPANGKIVGVIGERPNALGSPSGRAWTNCRSTTTRRSGRRLTACAQRRSKQCVNSWWKHRTS